MWRWASELHEVGFRRKGDRYWQCERRHGLPAWGYVSLFCWSEERLNGSALTLVELDAFHVTLLLHGERLHFYYHEHGDNEWERGGHTSSTEILRLGLDPSSLRTEADSIASRLIACLGGVLSSP